jgi:hypothetical protein
LEVLVDIVLDESESLAFELLVADSLFLQNADAGVEVGLWREHQRLVGGELGELRELINQQGSGERSRDSAVDVPEALLHTSRISLGLAPVVIKPQQSANGIQTI